MSRTALEALIIFLLLLVNGVFAMAEIAVVSARKARLQQMADDGNARARAALALAMEPNQFLAAVQIGITLVGILAGAFGGATIAEQIATRLDAVPTLAPYGETIGVGVVVIVITYFSLVLGELVPKRLGLGNAERVASAVAIPMRTLTAVAAPLVRLLSGSTDLVIRLLGVKPSTQPPITPEEIRVLLDQGTSSGVFETSEQSMIERVLQLDEHRIGAFMTPRRRVVSLDVADSPDDIRRKIAHTQHSRFPVVEDSLENVLGVVRARDLLDRHLAGQPLDLRILLRPPVFLPESMSALRALDELRRQGTHLALVMDEYGGIQGLVTHNDILEAIAGHFPAIGEPVRPQATRREDGSWLVDGLLPVTRLMELFDLDRLPDQDEEHYQTVAGFVLAQLRSIPVVGQTFTWADLRFEVVDMDGRRVDKVLVIPGQTPAEPEA